MDKLASKYLVIIVAILISIITALPHIYGYFQYSSQYTPFNLYEKNQYQRDELYAYAAQVQQVLKGHAVGDSYLWEGRDNPSPFLSELISIAPIAVLSLILGSIKFAFVASDLIFPTLLFFIIFYNLKKNYHYLWSLTTASAVIFLPFFSSLVPFFSKGGYLWTGTSQEPLFITRTPHPQISLIILFLTIFTIITTLGSKNNKSLVPIAILAALSLYSSVFISSTVLLAVALLFPILIKNTKKKEIVFAVLIFMVISSPWAVNFLGYKQFLLQTDFFMRASYPKEILFPRQLRYIFFAIILFFTSRNIVSKVVIAFAVASGILMDLHQVFLGRSIDADHWITRVIAPVATFALFLIIASIIKKTKYYRFISLFFLILIISIGLFVQIKWIDKNKNLLVPDTAKTNVFETIMKNTNRDDVIAGTTLELNQFITGATGRYVYVGPPERALVGSNERLKRICDIYQIAIDKNLSTLPNELLEQEIYFQKWKLNNKIDKDLFISQCYQKNRNPYKVDFIADKKTDGNYQLIKY